ncbi:MAG TPA: C40 family peptidase [Pseudonocardiaceae bacterium]
MRPRVLRRVLLAAVGVIAVIGLLATGVVAALLGSSGSNQAIALPCLPTLDPINGGGTSPIGPEELDQEQVAIATEIIRIGKERGLPPRAWQVALQAGMTESKLRNLNYGDRDSLGIFQMRPSTGWGTPEQVTNVTYQVHAFYGGPDHPPGNPGLLDVPGWEQMRPGDAAQKVERSAFPDRYHAWEALAVSLIGQLGGVENPGGCTPSPGLPGDVPPPTEAAGTAIAFALAQIGKPYVWGATGPNSFDCSGLMLRAYEAAGIQLPRVSRQQVNAGAKLPIENALPGDMLFWARDRNDLRTVHHVAMYLGGGQIVEAQQTGVPVHTRAIRFTERGLLPFAVRPGV